MSCFSVANVKHVSLIVDQLALTEDWSFGRDGQGGITDPAAFLILEEIYTHLNNMRLEISSIKYFKNIEDPLAYEWHRDDSNPRESDISTSALVYLPGCEGSAIEFRDEIYYPNPYDLILFKNNVEHRGLNTKHGPLLKYTFL
jgi:hypothetical protein